MIVFAIAVTLLDIGFLTKLNSTIMALSNEKIDGVEYSVYEKDKYKSLDNLNKYIEKQNVEYYSLYDNMFRTQLDDMALKPTNEDISLFANEYATLSKGKYLAVKDIEDLGLTIVHGRMATGDREVVLPNTFVDAILEVKTFKIGLFNEVVFDSVESIFNYDFQNVKVVGVFDVNIKFDKYKIISNDNRKSNKYNLLEQEEYKKIEKEFNDLVDNNLLCSYVIINENFVNTFFYDTFLDSSEKLYENAVSIAVGNVNTMDTTDLGKQIKFIGYNNKVALEYGLPKPLNKGEVYISNSQLSRANIKDINNITITLVSGSYIRDRYSIMKFDNKQRIYNYNAKIVQDFSFVHSDYFIIFDSETYREILYSYNQESNAYFLPRHSYNAKSLKNIIDFTMLIDNVKEINTDAHCINLGYGDVDNVDKIFTTYMPKIKVGCQTIGFTILVLASFSIYSIIKNYFKANNNPLSVLRTQNANIWNVLSTIIFSRSIVLLNILSGVILFSIIGNELLNYLIKSLVGVYGNIVFFNFLPLVLISLFIILAELVSIVICTLRLYKINIRKTFQMGKE